MPSLPVFFKAAPLPPQFKGTPQQFLDALVARLGIESQEQISFFVSGSTEPSSNLGPWLKDGTTWYVWSDDSGSYVPQTIETASLGYIVQTGEPDLTTWNFWIELDGSGKATSVKRYYSGAWHDVYEDKFATYSTTAQMNTAIANAVAAINSFPSAVLNSSQQVDVDTAAHVIQFDTIVFDPDDAFDDAQYRYVAPEAGYYSITAEAQVDNYNAQQTTLEIAFFAAKNGALIDTISSGVAVASPPGQRWYPSCSGLVQLAADDYVDIQILIGDTVNTGSVSIGNASLSVHRVQTITA